MFSNWLTQNIGQVNLTPWPPHGIKGQCVSAAASWSMAQGGGELVGATAWDIWIAEDSNYQKITSNYQPGDIMFYLPNNQATGTGSAGHVDLFVKSIPGGFQGADTDWKSSPILQYINHSFAGIVGAFRLGEDVNKDQTIAHYETVINQLNAQVTADALAGKTKDQTIAHYETVINQLNAELGTNTVLAPGVYQVK